MVVLNTPRAVVAGLFVSWAASCAPLDISVFESEPLDDSERPPIIIGSGGGSGGTLGGSSGGDNGGASMGGQPDPITFFLDDFEDGDSRATDPAEWWYLVNDGTGTQTLSVVEVDALAVSAELAEGRLLQIFSEGFTGWGSAWGVDIGNVPRSGPSLELSFSMVADRNIEVTFHALDETGDHFTRTLFLTPSWSRYVIRLDALLFVDGSEVRMFDVATATELQWFIYGEEATTVWLDNAVLHSF